MLSLIFPVKKTHTKTKNKKQQTNKEIKSIKITTTCNNQGKNYEFTKAKLIIRSGWLSVKERRLSRVKVLLNFKFCILCRGGGGFSRHRGRCPESVWALLSATLIMTHSFPGAYKWTLTSWECVPSFGECPWRLGRESGWGFIANDGLENKLSSWKARQRCLIIIITIIILIIILISYN